MWYIFVFINLWQQQTFLLYIYRIYALNREFEKKRKEKKIENFETEKKIEKSIIKLRETRLYDVRTVLNHFQTQNVYRFATNCDLIFIRCEISFWLSLVFIWNTEKKLCGKCEKKEDLFTQIDWMCLYDVCRTVLMLLMPCCRSCCSRWKIHVNWCYFWNYILIPPVFERVIVLYCMFKSGVLKAKNQNTDKTPNVYFFDSLKKSNHKNVICWYLATELLK